MVYFLYLSIALQTKKNVTCNSENNIACYSSKQGILPAISHCTAAVPNFVHRGELRVEKNRISGLDS